MSRFRPQGKPKPIVSWLKDGQPLDTKRVNIRNSDKDSILFIRTSQREDSGVYEMTVKVDSFEDKANITLQIVGELHVARMFSLNINRVAHGVCRHGSRCACNMCKYLTYFRPPWWIGSLVLRLVTSSCRNPKRQPAYITPLTTTLFDPVCEPAVSCCSWTCSHTLEALQNKYVNHLLSIMAGSKHLTFSEEHTAYNLNLLCCSWQWSVSSELPGPPASAKLVDSWGFNAALEWTPPKDNGNTEITGYTVQKADKKTGVGRSSCTDVLRFLP